MTKTDIDKDRSAITMESSSKHIKMRPVQYDGTEDWEEYLSQFEILADINKWEYSEKGLYLASSLKGTARSILSDLNQDERRDFSKLKLALSRKFGSEYKAEMYRAKLQSRFRNKNETISELATSIMKLTRQAYPKADLRLLDTLAVDYFIDALDDPDIRLRLRQSQPETITQAETLAIRLETFKSADRVRHRTVCMSTEKTDPDKTENTGNSEIEKCIMPVLETFMNKISSEVGSIKSTMHSKPMEKYQPYRKPNFGRGKYFGRPQANNNQSQGTSSPQQKLNNQNNAKSPPPKETGDSGTDQQQGGNSK